MNASLFKPAPVGPGVCHGGLRQHPTPRRSTSAGGWVHPATPRPLEGRHHPPWDEVGPLCRISSVSSSAEDQDPRAGRLPGARGSCSQDPRNTVKSPPGSSPSQCRPANPGPSPPTSSMGLPPQGPIQLP
ncbi:hypothetical protein HJG60_009173 [Phyllostomus discolor]|uniref:Uncharacterized protein n=1 Tax=Phyllostomus discolor TaxID=89673 RepID=A0A833YQK4_9CHIR|nr:hypothetical protein HJG60_009173 [Phyllostomus discolor]